MRNAAPFKLLCAAGFFAIFSSTASKSPVLPLFAAHLGADAAGVGVVAAASTLAGVLFSIPAGLLSDRFGRRTMLVAAGGVFASAPLLYLAATAVWQLVAVRFYHGLATAIFMPVAMAYVSEMNENAKGETLGWFSTATLLGRFLAPLAGGALLGLAAPGGAPAFVPVYAVCLAGGALALFVSTRVRTPEPGPANRLTWRGCAAGLREMVASGPLLALGAAEAAVLFVYGTIEVFLPLYALGRGIGTFEVGVCLAAQVVTLAATKPFMGRLSDRRGRSGQILWGAALGVFAAAGLAFCSGFFSILALSVLVGLSLSIVTSATSAAVADVSRCEMRGSAMGIFGTIMDLGHTAGPLVSGVAAYYFGFQAAFIGAALVLAAAAAVFAATAFDKLPPCAIGGQR